MDVVRQKNELKQVDGTYQALVMQMNLRSSTYATMAIRELTRMDTGKTYQSKLTEEVHDANKNGDDKSTHGTKRSIEDVDRSRNEYQLKYQRTEETS